MKKLKSEFLKRNETTTLLNFRCTPEEKDMMKKNADKFADGKLSAWIRYAAIHSKPNRKHLVK